MEKTYQKKHVNKEWLSMTFVYIWKIITPVVLCHISKIIINAIISFRDDRILRIGPDTILRIEMWW